MLSLDIIGLRGDDSNLHHSRKAYRGWIWIVWNHKSAWLRVWEYWPCLNCWLCQIMHSLKTLNFKKWNLYFHSLTEIMLLLMHHLFRWLNFSCLHNSVQIIFPAHSCVFFCFVADLQHAIIRWLIASYFSLLSFLVNWGCCNFQSF